MLGWLLDRCASGVDWPAQLRSRLGQKKGKKREGRKKRLFAIFSKEDILLFSFFMNEIRLCVFSSLI
jgi:hypothetical protein